MRYSHCFLKIKDQGKQSRLSGLFFGIIIASIVITIVLGVKALFYTPYSVVTVQFNEAQCVIADHFDLKWTHSVEKQSWVESYQVKNDQLLLTDTYLQTFGAGTPSTGTIGEKNELYPDYVHYKLNIQLPYLNWMISSNINPEIITEQKTLPIHQWISDYTNIYIFARTQSLWTLLRQESCNEYAQRRSKDIV